MTRDEVLDAVYDEVTAKDTCVEDAVVSLLEEIVRLRRILAALREPSEAVVKAVKECIYEELGIEYWDGKTRRIMYYAIEAAEQEASA